MTKSRHRLPRGEGHFLQWPLAVSVGGEAIRLVLVVLKAEKSSFEFGNKRSGSRSLPTSSLHVEYKFRRRPSFRIQEDRLCSRSRREDNKGTNRYRALIIRRANKFCLLFFHDRNDSDRIRIISRSQRRPKQCSFVSDPLNSLIFFA